MTPLIVALGIYLQVFGLVTVIGGLIGYVKAKSRASLIAGGISGTLLVAAGYLVGHGSRRAIFVGLLVSAALAGRFGMAFKKSRKFMPAGLILLLAIAGVGLSVAALVTPAG